MSARTDGVHGAAGVHRGLPGVGVRTVFIGTGQFGVAALRRLDIHDDLDLVAVVTAPPRRAGRGHRPGTNPVAGAAGELAVPELLEPERLRAPEAVARVLSLSPGLIVLADYGQIVPAALLDVPHGALNLHPSLLPRHRGATPIPAAILAGDAETGVTLMRMDAGLDTGPIVAQERVRLTGTETTPQLEARLEQVAADLLVTSVGPWIRGELRTVPQPEEGATLTRPLRREDGRLDPSRAAEELERMVRAYLPWPGTYLEVEGERLVVTEAAVATSLDGDVPGSLVRHGDRAALVARDGRLVLIRVTPAGRRPMDSAAWLRGRRRTG